MNREGIIIIICIGIVVLFYLFQNNTAAVEQVDLVKEPIVQSSDDIIKGAVQLAPKKVYSTTPDSLDNKEIQGNQPK
ncbi:uncharacterized protein METZ01_LOCUS367861 [marine metagenome]|uniref:Uncharacterized protein n=1 Tax=marine metagenome TaxID=408172 RepID=A0A382T0H9_9ZZZZ